MPTLSENLSLVVGALGLLGLWALAQPAVVRHWSERSTGARVWLLSLAVVLMALGVFAALFMVALGPRLEPVESMPGMALAAICFGSGGYLLLVVSRWPEGTAVTRQEPAELPSAGSTFRALAGTLFLVAAVAYVGMLAWDSWLCRGFYGW